MMTGIPEAAEAAEASAEAVQDGIFSRIFGLVIPDMPVFYIRFEIFPLILHVNVIIMLFKLPVQLNGGYIYGKEEFRLE